MQLLNLVVMYTHSAFCFRYGISNSVRKARIKTVLTVGASKRAINLSAEQTKPFSRSRKVR